MNNPLDLLKFILECRMRSVDEKVLQDCYAYVEYKQDIADLQMSSFCILIPGFVVDNYAKFSVVISKSDKEELYLALLALRNEEWALAALMKRCPICNGSQQDGNRDPCVYCCAMGWGEEQVWKERVFPAWLE